MANLYGVANNIGIPIYTNLIGAANVTCPAGVETNVADSGLIIAPSNGYFCPIWTGMLTLATGATDPTGVVLGGRIGAGSDFANFTIPTNLFTPTTNILVSFFLAGPSSQVAWQSPGTHVFLTVNPTAQGVTASQIFSTTFFWLVRGPDQ